MSLTVTIPDSVAVALKVPEAGREDALKGELAVALYADGLLSLGKARELAGLGKHEFGRLLGQHRVSRQYTRADLAVDQAYADRQ